MSGSDNPLGGESTVHPGREQSGATNRVVDPTDMPLPTFSFDQDFDPAQLPIRPWIIMGRLLRGYITAFVAPAGVGKSMFALIFAIMVATGKLIHHAKLQETANVLVLNNEEDEDEIKRRVAAICLHSRIPFSDLTGKFYGLSGYGRSFLIAQRMDDHTVVAAPDTVRIIAFCKRQDIGLLVIDPFVSTHDVPENDNTEIEKVVSEYRSIAKETGVAILLVHHTRKIGKDSEAHAGDVEASRGASSLIGAARIAFTLARMSKETADKHGIDWHVGNRLLRLDDGKMNFSLKLAEAEWYEMVSVDLPNGDSVGVPVPFDISELAKRAEAEKAEDRTKQIEARVTEIANTVANFMTDDEQPQGEIISAYMAKTGLKRTAANDAIKMLPVGSAYAVKVTVNNVRTAVWRERHGNKNRPHYTIRKLAEV